MSSGMMRVWSVTVGVELLSVLVVLCLAGSALSRGDNDDELLGELDLLLPTSGDNIQVVNVLRIN